MLALLRDLLAHKGHANAALLTAMGGVPAAAADAELSALFHHVLLANRFWLLAIRGEAFDLATESQASASFADLVRRYATLQADEEAWLDAAGEHDLDRRLEHPSIPGGSCAVRDAWLQVCLHAHGHRAQAAKLLRRHGVTPPMTDYILWLTRRAPAQWPAAGD